MNILNNFDTNTNFWQINPQLKIPFFQFMKNDKSRNKSYSSQIMWGIALVYDPKTKLNNISLEERKTLVKAGYLKDLKDFKWKKYTEEIALYQKLCISRASRILARWEKDLDDRDAFLGKISYENGTVEEIDLKEKYLERTLKMWQAWEACKKTVENEEGDGSSKGGTMISLSDDNQI